MSGAKTAQNSPLVNFLVDAFTGSELDSPSTQPTRLTAVGGGGHGTGSAESFQH